MQKHACVVLRTVGQVVTGRIHVKLLIPFLDNMGKRHGKYGVEVEYFKGMGEALIWTMEQAVGVRWTPELQSAWRRTYNILKEVMVMAIKQERATDGAQKVIVPAVGCPKHIMPAMLDM
jgi:hemoglobin-like flavoprotein